MTKKAWLLTLLLCLLTAAVTLAVVKLPRTVPLDQCSEVYQRYHDVPGIRAAFIRDKQINDTLKVDMTLLVADDSLAFANLLKSWNNSDEFITDMMSSVVDENTRFIKMHPKGHPELPKDMETITNNEWVAIFPMKRAVAFFHTQTEEEINTIKTANYREKVNI